MKPQKHWLYYLDRPTPIPVYLGWEGEVDGTPLVKETEEDHVELVSAWQEYRNNSDMYASENPESNYGFHVTANGTVIHLEGLLSLVPDIEDCLPE